MYIHTRICVCNIVQLLSCVQLFATPWIVARQAFLSFTISRSLLKFMSIESVMPSNHLIFCLPLLLLLSIFPSIRVFPNDLFMQKRFLMGALKSFRQGARGSPSPSASFWVPSSAFRILHEYCINRTSFITCLIFSLTGFSIIFFGLVAFGILVP